MVDIINCDIFHAPIDILVHCANCQVTMGAGIAKEVKDRYPEAFLADQKTKAGDTAKMGTYSVAKIKGKGRLRFIVNLYAQFDYGRETRQLDYEALYAGLLKLKNSIAEKGLSHLVIGIPYGMGCGNAGGSWHVVGAIIEDIFDDERFQVLICKQ